MTFVKRVMVFGVPILLAAGYYADDIQSGSDHEDNGGSDSPPGDDAQGAGQGGSATLLYWQAPTILNPYLSRGTKDAEAASLVLEPLAEYTPNGEIVPVLATQVPTSENGGFSADRTSITWTIREDALWSDGTPLTANDVVFYLALLHCSGRWLRPVAELRECGLRRCRRRANRHHYLRWTDFISL